MAPNEPLFAAQRRSSSTHSDERAADEDTALLGTQRGDTGIASRSRYGFWRELGLFTWAVVATAAVIVLAVLSQHQASHQHDKKPKHTGKRNLIFMVSDGMGPASLSMARSFRQFQGMTFPCLIQYWDVGERATPNLFWSILLITPLGGLPHDDVLILDQQFIGSSRTRSTSSFITDSAAGATAFSCGLKSYNGAISMLPDHSPCGTVLEAAKKAGYLVPPTFFLHHSLKSCHTTPGPSFKALILLFRQYMD
jgi:alkaline phosphatase